MKLIMTDIVRNVSDFIDVVSSKPEMATVTLNGLNNTQFDDCLYIITNMIGENILKDISEVNLEDEIESGRKTINYLIKEECLRENIKCVILGLYDAGIMEYSVKLIMKRGKTISREHMQGFAMAFHPRLGASSPYSQLHYEHINHLIAPDVFYNTTNITDYTTTDPAILYTILDTLYIQEEGIIDEGFKQIDAVTEAKLPLYFIMSSGLKENMIEVLDKLLVDDYRILEVNHPTRNDSFRIILYNQKNEACTIVFIFNNISDNLMEIIVSGVSFGNLEHRRFTKPSIFIYFLEALIKNYSFEEIDDYTGDPP